MFDLKYVLISACRNESLYIDQLIDTVSGQTIKPYYWIIVDDSSTDDTFERAKSLIINMPYIKLVKMPTNFPRSFASKAYATKYAYDLINNELFDFIGFLDADIRLKNNYYESIIKFMVKYQNVGLVGGSVIDIHKDAIIDNRKGSEDYHVSGGVQFFRRECFEQIGGYVPTDGGGMDTIADIMSMMNGWKIKTLPDLICMHLRPEGSFQHGTFKRGIVWGEKFYKLGYHPIYYLGQCVKRIGNKPVLLASIWQLLGFIISTLKAEPRYVSDDFVIFLRKLQMNRLKQIFRFK